MPRFKTMKTILRLVLATSSLSLIALCIFLQQQGVFDQSTPQQSVSVGSSELGYLINGKSLPCSGPNFRAYHPLGCFLRRNSVHGVIRDIVLETYAQIQLTHPEFKYVYGETGWPRGGHFRPHKSHRNGLCVDFFVPVRRNGNIAEIDASVANQFGYGLDFDDSGKLRDFEIDWESMIVHLRTLQAISANHGVTVRFVIFDNKLQEILAKHSGGQDLLKSVRFSRLPSWVRHDEHYHVEFDLNLERRGTGV